MKKENNDVDNTNCEHTYKSHIEISANGYSVCRSDHVVVGDCIADGIHDLGEALKSVETLESEQEKSINTRICEQCHPLKIEMGTNGYSLCRSNHIVVGDCVVDGIQDLGDALNTLNTIISDK